MTSRSTQRRPEQADPIIAVVEPEEVLVADARNGLTPVQIVDRKLLALLGQGPGQRINSRNRSS